MPFTTSGDKLVTLGEVRFSDPKFSKDPNAFDVCIKVTATANLAEEDWARLEMSSDYSKLESRSHMTQAQVSMETLAKLGFEGSDLTTLQKQLAGRDAVAHFGESKPNDKGQVFINFKYFKTGGSEPVAVDESVVKARMAALFGAKADATASAPATTAAQKPTPTTSAAKSNPFARK